MKNDDSVSSASHDEYEYDIPVYLPIFEQKDSDYYRWVIHALISPRYKPGLSRLEFMHLIKKGYDDAVARNDTYLIKVWPKPEEMEYLIDWFAVYKRFIRDLPKDYKIFRD